MNGSIDQFCMIFAKEQIHELNFLLLY